MILQFGKTPPPIGGISIHIKRLLNEFKITSLKMELLDYSKDRNVFSIISKVCRNKIVHIHLSRKLHRLFVIVLFRSLFKKVIVTFHGKYDFNCKYDYFSLKFANASILLNEFSYKNALKVKKNGVNLIGAFIPHQKNSINSLLIETKMIIGKFNLKYETVFCTNAWNVVFDNEGREIYNGSLLLEIFEKLNNIALVFSDPVGNYSRYLKNKYGNLPENIHFITYEHDFIDVINLTSAFIRPTTTDGDSLSVNEALYLNKDVVTSDVVDRPQGCILYKTNEELQRILLNFKQYQYFYKKYSYKNIILELKNLYLAILS